MLVPALKNVIFGKNSSQQMSPVRQIIVKNLESITR